MTCNAENPPASNPPSTPNCSGPGSCCSNAATPSTTPNRPASTGSSAHPRLKARWDTLQQLHGLYLADNRFTDPYATGEPPEYHRVVDTVITCGDQILDWHDTKRPSNGRTEGTNNLPRVQRRTAHGLTNADNFAPRRLLVTKSPNRHQRTLTPPKRAVPRSETNSEPGLSPGSNAPTMNAAAA